MTLVAMKAAQYDRYGKPGELYLAQVDKPTVKAGEVLVRIHAASVNGIDLIVRAGTLRMVTGKVFPRRIGLDFAGEVAEASESAPQFKLGDHVWGALPHGQTGSAAEYVSVPAEQLSHSPAGLSLIDAAALPAVGVAAITALRDIGALKPGQKLLVRGGSGGVGSIAVQLGHALGAHVTALAGAGSLKFVERLGADHVYDYATTKPADLGVFDFILDTVGSQTAAYRRLLTRAGRMTTICPDPKRPLSSLAYTFLSRIHGGRRVRMFSAKPQTTNLRDLAHYVEEGAIRPIVDRVYPLSAISEAHQIMENGGRHGKQIIALVEPANGYIAAAV